MHTIQCAEIWGGNHASDEDVCTTGITATISSVPAGFSRGGDIYYFSVCSHDILTRVLIADLRGHGLAASEISDWLYQLMLEYMNSLDGAGLLADLNRAVIERGHSAITSAMVLSYNRSDHTLHYANAGHPAPLHWSPTTGWQPLSIPDLPGPVNLPLGILPTARYQQHSFQLTPGDRIFLYTDGITECPNPSGDFFDESRLLTLLDVHTTSSLYVLKQDLRTNLCAFSQGPLLHDDTTFLALDLRP